MVSIGKILKRSQTTPIMVQKLTVLISIKIKNVIFLNYLQLIKQDQKKYHLIINGF